VLPKHIPPPPFLLQNVILKSSFQTKIAYDASKQHVFILRGKNGFWTIEEKTVHDSIRQSNFANFNPFISTSTCHFEVKFLNKIYVQYLYVTCSHTSGGKYGWNHWGENIATCTWLNKALQFLRISILSLHFKLSFSSHISKHKLCMMHVSNIFHTLGENLFWNHWRKTHCKHVHDWIRHYIFSKFQSCYCHLKMSLWSQISKQNVCTVPVCNMFSYFGGKLILEPLRENTFQACTWLNKALHFL
jgi:hypothetical protein